MFPRTDTQRKGQKDQLMEKEGDSGLSRVLGRWDLTAIGVNQVIGSGVFVLPASVALLVGAGASPWVWVVAGIVNALIVLCFAEAGARFRGVGGPYLYARAAFCSLTGFEIAWMIWLTRVSGQAALANALALYLGYLVPGARVGWGRTLVLVATIAVLAGINWRGVRYGSWTVNIFTLAKLVPLSAFVLIGFFFIDWSNFSSFLEPQMSGFGEGVLLLMFAFGGYELVTIPAGEARTPRRDVPKALLMTIAIVCGLYILIQVVAVGTLPGLGETQTPLADAAAGFMGPLAGTLMAMGGLVSIAGANAGTMLAGPRVTFALAEGGQLPQVLAHIHRRFRSPDNSIFLYAAVSLALALSGSFVQLAAVSAVARLIFYAATCAAVLSLRRRDEDRTPAVIPWGPVIPLAALAGSLIVIAGADQVSLLAGAAALIAGAIIHFSYQAVSGKKSER